MGRRKITIISLLSIFALLIITFIIVIATNFSCIQRLSVEHKYRKDHGVSLLFGLADTFDAWGNDIDQSTAYTISKECMDRFGKVYSDEAIKNIRKAVNNNIVIDDDEMNVAGRNTISINSCILLKDIKVLYLTYNKYFANKDKIINLSLYDDKGNKIADQPSFTSATRGLLFSNAENYFWGIDFDQHEGITLHIKVYSAAYDLISEYDQPIWKN